MAESVAAQRIPQIAREPDGVLPRPVGMLLASSDLRCYGHYNQTYE